MTRATIIDRDPDSGAIVRRTGASDYSISCEDTDALVLIACQRGRIEDDGLNGVTPVQLLTIAYAELKQTDASAGAQDARVAIRRAILELRRLRRRATDR